MSSFKIAAQLYTIRNFMKTPEDIAASLQKVKDIGYSEVQVSGIGKIDPKDLKEITDRLGLKICVTHIPYDRLWNDLDAVITEHKLWECKYVGLGSMPADYRNSKEGYIKFAKEASEIARKLANKDLRFVYHNHNFEFQRFDGMTGMDILFNETDSEVFDFEIDTYWVQAGGADPVAWIKKVENRMKVVHFKDMMINPENKQIFAEVGEGNLNWKAIIKACEEIGVEYAAVEQDECLRNPFESLAISYNNLKAMGL